MADMIAPTQPVPYTGSKVRNGGRGPRIPAPSPSSAVDTYYHRGQIDGLYYQGNDKGVYNSIHQKNADDLYYQGTTKAGPNKATTAPGTKLLLQQQQLGQRGSTTRRRTTTPLGDHGDPARKRRPKLGPTRVTGTLGPTRRGVRTRSLDLHPRLRARQRPRTQGSRR